MQIGALRFRGCAVPKAIRCKRLTGSLDKADYKALHELWEAQKPPLNLQSLVRYSVRNLLDHHAGKS